MNRYCKWIAAAAFAGCFSLYAQTGADFASEAKQAYDHVKNNIIKAAQEMPDEDYNFQPTPDIRTFGALIGHIAAAQAHYCSAAEGTHMQLDTSSMKTKAELVSALQQSSEECDKAYDAANPSNIGHTVGAGRMQRSELGVLYANIAHDNEEYGYMAVYLRLKGQVPPSSQPRTEPVRH